MQNALLLLGAIVEEISSSSEAFCVWYDIDMDLWIQFYALIFCFNIIILGLNQIYIEKLN